MKRRPLRPEEHPKGSGKYRVRPRVDGKVVTVCSGVSLAVALEELAAFERIAASAETPLEQGVTLTSFGKGFLDRRERRGVQGIDQERDRWSLMVERDPIGKIAIASLVRSDFLDWLDRWASKGRQTRKNGLNLMRSALDECVDRELCARNVARDVKVPRAGRASEFDDLGGVLEPHEQTALLAVIPEGADRDAVEFALYGGLRQSSHWNLRRDACGIDRVSLRRHKSGRPRVLNLIPQARPALARSLARAARLGSPWAFPAARGGRRHKGKIPVGFKAWLKAAGITRRVRWHDLRHTCATSLLAGWWGPAWSLTDVRDYLHHSSVKVTERYARRLAEMQHKAVAAMEASLPARSPEAALPIIDLPEISAGGADRIRTDVSRFCNPVGTDALPPGSACWEPQGGKSRSPAAAWALALAVERVAHRRSGVLTGTTIIRRGRVRDAG